MRFFTLEKNQPRKSYSANQITPGRLSIFYLPILLLPDPKDVLVYLRFARHARVGTICSPDRVFICHTKHTLEIKQSEIEFAVYLSIRLE